MTELATPRPDEFHAFRLEKAFRAIEALRDGLPLARDPELLVEKLPRLRAGESITCPRCSAQHRVTASPDSTPRGNPVALVFRCGNAEHIAGLFGRNVLRMPKPEARAAKPLPLEEMTDVGRLNAVKQLFTDDFKHEVVRKILEGKSTPMKEAGRMKIASWTIEEWCEDPALRRDVPVTIKSGYKPKESRAKFARAFKQELVDRVRKGGEHPDNVARDFLGVTPSMLRAWCEGWDMGDDVPPPPPKPVTAAELLAELEAKGVQFRIEGGILQARPLALIAGKDGERLRPLRGEIIALVKQREIEAEEKKAAAAAPHPALAAPAPAEEEKAPAPEPPAPEPAPAGPARHPKHDEAVQALISGMSPLEIIEALELKDVSIDDIFDWGVAYRKPLRDPSAHGKMSRFPDALRKRFAERLVAGEAPAALGKEIGLRDSSLIRRWCSEFGLMPPAPLVPSGPRSAPGVREKADAMIAAGASRVEVAKACGISYGTVQTWERQWHAKRAAEKAAPPAPQPPAAPQPPRETVTPVTTVTPPPAPAPPEPSRIITPEPRKIRAVQLFLCPHCDGRIEVPPPVPGALRSTRGECPHCGGEVIL